MLAVSSHNDLLEKVKETEKVFVVLYKKGSELSDCALTNLTRAAGAVENIHLLTVDVSSVRDVHTEYGVKTVPTLLIFEKGQFSNVVKGCMSTEYYKALFEDDLYVSAQTNDEGKPKQKPVTVYSTPTCVWCNRIKDHFNRNGIVYTDIDVSANPAKAEEMKRRSGQMGVPQTDIGGEMIVGFDKARINKLLGING